MSHIGELRKLYLESLCAWRCYRALDNSRTISAIGKETAEANAEAMQRFSTYFPISIQAVHVLALLDLAKIFDRADQSLHLRYVLGYIARHREKFSRDAFRQFNEGRIYLDELYENYKGMTVSDIRKAEHEFKAHEALIEKLKEYRDQYLAHRDRAPQKVGFSFEEIESLFALAEKLLNLFTAKLDDSTTLFDRIGEDVERDVEYLLTALDVAERNRRLDLRNILKVKKNAAG